MEISAGGMVGGLNLNPTVTQESHETSGRVGEHNSTPPELLVEVTASGIVGDLDLNPAVNLDGNKASGKDGGLNLTPSELQEGSSDSGMVRELNLNPIHSLETDAETKHKKNSCQEETIIWGGYSSRDSRQQSYSWVKRKNVEPQNTPESA